MKLEQRRIPFVRESFELGEQGVTVESESLFKSKKFEIPYSELRAQLIEVKQFPIAWCVGTVLVSTLFPIIVTSMISARDDERVGLIVFTIMDLAVALCSWLAFLERRIDAFVFPLKNGGRSGLAIRRSLPSAEHVRRFIEGLKVRIDEAKVRWQQ